MNKEEANFVEFLQKERPTLEPYDSYDMTNNPYYDIQCENFVKLLSDNNYSVLKWHLIEKELPNKNTIYLCYCKGEYYNYYRLLEYYDDKLKQLNEVPILENGFNSYVNGNFILEYNVIAWTELQPLGV